MWRVVDIGGQGYSLKSADNKLIVNKDGTLLSEIPYNDINSIIIHSYDTVLTSSLMRDCAHRGIPITICDEKHLPAGILLSSNQNQETGKRLGFQINASLPKKKTIWKEIVEAKLLAQAKVLEISGRLAESQDLVACAKSVKSGDTTNREAVGARIYFRALFSDDFSRTDESFPANGSLNYGYTIVRSAVCRSIVASGLNPGLSVFHSNSVNSYALADDLMEPLRPMVDFKVFSLLKVINENQSLSSTLKRELISVLTMPVVMNGKKVEMVNAIEMYVQGYLKCLSSKDIKMIFPVLF